MALARSCALTMGCRVLFDLAQIRQEIGRLYLLAMHFLVAMDNAAAVRPACRRADGCAPSNATLRCEEGFL